MSSEERVTVKGAAAEVLPAIIRARAALAVHLTSIDYVSKHIDKMCDGKVAEEGYELSRALSFLEDAEEVLCRL